MVFNFQRRNSIHMENEKLSTIDSDKLIEKAFLLMKKRYLHEQCNHEIIQTKDHTLFPFLYGKYAFMITDAEPENDIHIVFESFIKLNQYPLVAIANWNANAYGQTLLDRYKNNYLIKMLDPQIQLRTLNMIRTNCFIYIDAYHQPDETYSLLEAMYMQLPVIAYDSEYNKKLTGSGAFYYKTMIDLLIILQSLHPMKAYENGALMKQIFNSQLEKLHPMHSTLQIEEQ